MDIDDLIAQFRQDHPVEWKEAKQFIEPLTTEEMAQFFIRDHSMDELVKQAQELNMGYD